MSLFAKRTESTVSKPLVLVGYALTETSPAVLGYDDLARLLRCSRRVLEDLVSREVIPHVHLGVRVIFYWPAIDAWLKQGGKLTTSRRSGKRQT